MRSISLTRHLAVLALCAACLIGVAACDRKPATAEEPTAITVVVQSSPTSLDPLRVLDTHTHTVAAAVHAPLSLVDKDGRIVPVIADQVQMAADGLSCQIVLNPNARFWDSSAVTVRDVRFTFERLRRSPHPHRWVLDRVKGVDAFDKKEATSVAGFEVVDDLHLVVRFSQADPDFSKFISSGLTSIVKAGSDDTPAKRLDLNIIGCGHFKPSNDKYEGSTRFKFVRNEGFPRESRLQKIVFEVVPEVQNQLEGIASGKVHIARLRGSMLGEAIQGAEPGQTTLRSAFSMAKLHQAHANELAFMMFNWKNERLAAMPEESRRGFLDAISTKLNRETLVSSLYLGFAQQAQSVIPPTAVRSDYTWQRRDALPAGAPKDNLTLLAANDPDSRRLAAFLQGQMGQAGVNVDLAFVELGTLVQRLLSGDYELSLFWIEQQIPGGPVGWTQFFREGGAFAAAVGQPVKGINEQLDIARGTLADDARAEAYRRLGQTIDTQQSAWLPLVSRDTVYLVNASVDRVFLDANGVPYWAFVTTQPR